MNALFLCHGREVLQVPRNELVKEEFWEMSLSTIQNNTDLKPLHKQNAIKIPNSKKESLVTASTLCQICKADLE